MWEFFTQALGDGLALEFEWQQVSRTLLSIPADLKNAVVWMIFTRSFISKSNSSLVKNIDNINTISIHRKIFYQFLL